MNKEIVAEFYNSVVKKKQYWMPLLILSVVAYGFSIVSRTVSVDDLAEEYYLGSRNLLLRGLRWGSFIWSKIITRHYGTIFIYKFIALVFLVLSAIIISFIFYYLNSNQTKPFLYTVLSGMIITFPLINEIWEYNLATMIAQGDLFIISVVALIIMLNKNNSWKVMIVTSLLMSVVMSSYESLGIAYISLVLMILFYKYVIVSSKYLENNWIKDGLRYSIPLLMGTLLRFVIGGIILLVTGYSYKQNGETEIKWFELGAARSIGSMIHGYFIKGLVYFPITIWVLVFVAFLILILVLCVKQKRILPFVLGLLLITSMFTQFLIQGGFMPYRVCQPMQIFMGWACFTIGICLKNNHKKLFIVFNTVIILVCWYQSIYLNNLFVLNNQRSNNEAQVISNIGYEYYKKYPNKKIVFVGEYKIGSWISHEVEVDEKSINGKLYMNLIEKYSHNKDSKKYIGTNINSVMNWSKTVFESQQMMKVTFNYYGYEINTLKENEMQILEEAEKKSKEKHLNTFEMYDMDSYVIVNMGN